MISGRRIAILLKIIAMKDKAWNQQLLSKELELSQSEISTGLTNLIQSKLIRKTSTSYVVVVSACEEFFVHGFRYALPLNHVGKGKGIVTSYAAPIFNGDFFVDENKPVWIYEGGNDEGIGVEPLYDKLPDAISKNQDNEFYNLLTIVDALREDRARERNLAQIKFKIALDNYAKNTHN